VPSRSGPKLALAGVAGLVVLVGGIFLYRACRSGEPSPAQLTAVVPTKVVPAPVQPPALDAAAEAGVRARLDASPTPPVDPEAALTAAEAELDEDEGTTPPEGHHAKRREKPAVARFLKAANQSFDRGKALDAVKWAARALNSGGGLRAHLALARYLRSMHRYREALVHYRAALALDADNKLAATGVAVLENQQSASP
jgi:hypothetical protein